MQTECGYWLPTPSQAGHHHLHFPFLNISIFIQISSGNGSCSASLLQLSIFFASKLFPHITIKFMGQNILGRHLTSVTASTFQQTFMMASMTWNYIMKHGACFFTASYSSVGKLLQKKWSLKLCFYHPHGAQTLAQSMKTDLSTDHVSDSFLSITIWTL